MKNKKTKIAILGVIALILVTIGITYAYWIITKTQTNRNVISSVCLDITMSGEKNDITLTNQVPISDEDGMLLVPYEFTVTNNCDTSVDYQVALESTGDETNAIAASSLKVALANDIVMLGNRGKISPTIEGAYEARKIGAGTLAPAGTDGATVTYELRIWLDKDAPTSEMNKTFKSKISVTIGQGISNPYKEGTLAYSILSNAGGTNEISEIDATEYAHRVTGTSDQYVSSSSNYYYGTDYKYNEETGMYTLSGDLVQATLEECRAGTKTCGKYTLMNTDSTYSSETLYEVTNFQSSGNYITSNSIRYTTFFSAAIKTGLYKTQDGLGDSYFYRGTPTNNYVEFGTYTSNYTRVRGYYTSTSTDYIEYATLEECNAATSYNYNCAEYTYASANDPMYWRIVRVNGDGTIRLIYDGIEKVENGYIHTATIGKSVFNSCSDNKKCSSYTYESSTQADSTIKGIIDTWYDAHLEANYDEYIADSIFCNDKESRVNNGNIYFGSYDRLITNKIPSLKCTNKSDSYTVNDTINGNGLLSNPVGLLSADEAFLGGSGHSYKVYLNSGEMYWTSTPYAMIGVTRMWYVHTTSSLENGMATSTDKPKVRPVINLKADVQFTGDGTVTNPYKIVVE